MSYNGDMDGCHACARTDGRTTECEDSARILETEFAMNVIFLQNQNYKLLTLIWRSLRPGFQPFCNNKSEQTPIFILLIKQGAKNLIALFVF